MGTVCPFAQRFSSKLGCCSRKRLTLTPGTRDQEPHDCCARQFTQGLTSGSLYIIYVGTQSVWSRAAALG